MATHFPSILTANLLPDTTGNVYPEPAALNLQANDRFPGVVWVFADTATRITLGGRFRVPNNYVGTAKVGLIWAVTGTANAVRWEFDYKAIAAGESSDPSTDDESVGSTVTVPGTARLYTFTEINLTSSNLVAGDWVHFKIARDGTDAGDTYVGSAFLEEAYLSYSDT
jgi:hypothetical protein